MTIYSYSRVSTGRQAAEGESLDVQQARSAAYAVAMVGKEVTAAHVERGVSGTVPFRERPEGGRLWASLKPGDVIVASKLDRMFRSALDGLETLSALQEKKVRLFLIDMGGDVTGNGVAKLVFTILSAVAEMERERTRERICETKAHQRAKGRYLGGAVPFGYRLGESGQLVVHAEEQAIISRMHAMRTDGLTLRAISAELKAGGVMMGHRTVADVLERSNPAATPASDANSGL